MGLRPARTCREVKGQPWARISKRKPRKSYIKGAPHPKVRQFNMGSDKRYELEVELQSTHPVNIRDNSLESARQAANKYAEKKLFQNFYLQVVPYPHLVVRESTSLGVAGADRISKGMKRAFGRPKGRMALLHKGDAVLRARIMKKDLSILKEAFRRARLKMPGDFTLNVRDITADSINMARKEHVFKKKEEEKPKEEPVAAAAATPAAEGETPAKEEKAAPEKKK